MQRRTFLKRVGGSAVASLAVAQTDERPNLVFILTDDMGWADIEPFGVKDIKTPALNRLAKQGVRLTHSYANACLCSPTRAAFLTGRYQQRFGFETALSEANPAHLKIGIPASEPNIAEILKANGYATAVYGKWHVGFGAANNPVNRGFDEYFGLAGGYFDMYSHKNRAGADDLWEGTNRVQREGYATDLFADRAVDFINRKAGKPFFLYLPFNAVHWPFQPPRQPPQAQPASALYDGTRRDYKLMLEALDAAIGRVMDALDRKGLTGNTLVVFTNDNGGERLSNNGGLFHHKGSLWEGGIRVPTILSWPKVLPAGATSTVPSVTFDLTATLLAAAKAKLPAGKQLDGIDLIPVLQKKAPAPERSLFWRFEQPQFGRRQYAVRRGRYKLIRDGGNTVPPLLPTDLLFDLEKDPQERNSLTLENPTLVAELQKEIAAWEAGLPTLTPAPAPAPPPARRSGV